MKRFLIAYLLIALCGLILGAEDDFVLPPNEFKPIKELGEYKLDLRGYVIFIRRARVLSLCRSVKFVP